MEQGNRSRALTEFEQARSLAPNNAMVATYLAEAYRRFGENARAQALLREQLTRNPGNAQLSKALSDLRAEMAASVPVPTPAPAPAVVLAQALASLPHVNSTPQAAPNLIAPSKPKIRPTPRRARNENQQLARMSDANPGYFFADKAYKASAVGDFATALPAAREAAQQAPENRAYGKLLVYVLAQSGAYEEADAMTGKLLEEAAADSQELTTQRQAIRRRLAFGHFETANQALRDGDSAAAIREARIGVAYAPDLLPYRLQLISTQLAAGRLDEANQAATEAINELQGEPALLIMRGYTRQRLGQWAAATTDFDQAVTHQGLTPSEQQNFRIIAAHAAMVAGEPKRALTLLDPLDATTDTGIGMRRQQASSVLRRSLYPNPATAPFLPTPGVICAGSFDAPACDVLPGQEPADPARPAAESAYQAYGARDYAVAIAKASEAVELSPANSPYRLLLVNALTAHGKLEQADQSATRFLSAQGDDAEMLAARSAVRQRLGQSDLAKEDAAAALRSDRLSLASEIAALVQLDRKPLARERFAAAVQDGLLDDQPDINVAYLAVLVGDDESALAAFDRATARNTLPDTAKADAAYTAGRLGRNDQALEYFKQTIDVAAAGKPFLTPQQLFNTRREVADRSRLWGANASFTYRGISPNALTASLPGAANDSLQAGAEVWWRPLGYRDGRLLELYAGLSETLSSKAGFPTGAESLQGAIGARVKPLVDVNLILALERRIAIGSKTTSDWLARMAYSGGAGTDMRVDVPNWMTTTVYAEAGRFINQHQTYATFEGQIGRSFRLDSVHPRLVVFPHAVLGADYNSSLTSGSKNAVGAGAGVSLRYWFNEDRYNAPRSYMDLSLQYRGRISGDDRAKGVFVRATLNF